MKSPQERAGELYVRGLEAANDAIQGRVAALPDHFITMLTGGAEFDVPLWCDRLVPPDGMHVVLDCFEDYLLLPPREGLGFESLHQVKLLLESIKGHAGDAVLGLIAKEIPDFAMRAKGEKHDHGKGGAHGGDRRSEGFQVANNNLKTSDDRATADSRRIQRDNPEVWERIMAGEISLNAAAIDLGYRKKMIQIPAGLDAPELARRIIAKFGVSSAKDLLHALGEQLATGEEK